LRKKVKKLTVNSFLKDSASLKSYNRPLPCINILGSGGIGTNLISFLCGKKDFFNSFKIDLYDYDIVELHNLNRTDLFNINDVVKKKKKVQAVKDNLSNNLSSFTRLNSSHDMKIDENSTFARSGIIIDARDTILPSDIPDKTWIKLAYDGGSNISFVFNPKEVLKRVFRTSTRSSYEITPSFYVPPAILSAFCMLFLGINKFVNTEKSFIIDFNIDEEIRRACCGRK